MFRQALLNITQPLSRLWSKFAVRELDQYLPALVFCPQALGPIAIATVHLFVVDLADSILRLGGFLHIGIEEDEILVFGFGLRETARSAFPIPAVRHSELGFRHEFARLIGVHQGLERDAGGFVAPVLYILHCLIEQHLVGLLGVLCDRRLVLLMKAAARHCLVASSYKKAGRED